MVDDQMMEKKCLTSCSTSFAKPSCSENKTNKQQDGGSIGNKFPRTPKRREPSNGPADTSRKSTPQRCRNFTDKRPRPRGGQYFDRDRSEVANLVDTSVDVDYKLGSKKVSLSHLLNFSFAPRVGADSNWLGASFHSSSRSKGRVKLPRYNKEQFLLANCQFVVNDGGSYQIHAADPDVLVNWAQIEEIHLSSYEMPLCPICLYPPVAAKITCCGHIYCWSCVLHYLALSDRTWRKCPICYEAVHKNDLKSVRITVKTSYKVGDVITFYLMQRIKGSAIPVPVVKWNGPPEALFHVKDESTTTEFQKILVASMEDVRDIIERERGELDVQLNEEKDTPESCFIVSAQQLLAERENKLEVELSCKVLCQSLESSTMQENTSSSSSPETKTLEIDYFDGIEQSPSVISDDAIFGNDTMEKPRECRISCSTDSSIGVAESIASEDNEQGCSSNVTAHENIKKPSSRDTGSYYFYQVNDGQHIYLHALNVKMLVKEYGSLENCPPVLTAKIVEVERASMTETIRKRLRYLQHLPLTCEFEVVEVQLNHPTVSEQTLMAFGEDIEKRRRQRNRRAREEKARERRIEVQENLKLGKYPPSEYCLDSLHQFPACSSSFTKSEMPEMQPGQDDRADENTSTEPHVKSPDTSPITDTPEEQASYKQASFAQMLREGKSKPWSSGPSCAVASDNPNRLLSIADMKGKESPELDCEDYIPPPTYQQSFSEAIQAALDNAVAQKKQASPDANGAVDGGKKKKKGKKMVLFSTNMNRKN